MRKILAAIVLVAISMCGCSSSGRDVLMNTNPPTEIKGFGVWHPSYNYPFDTINVSILLLDTNGKPTTAYGHVIFESSEGRLNTDLYISPNYLNKHTLEYIGVIRLGQMLGREPDDIDATIIQQIGANFTDDRRHPMHTHVVVIAGELKRCLRH